MKKHTFEIHTVDFGDDTESVWVAAWVDGDKGKGIGLYVDRNGNTTDNDHIEWCIQNDIEAMGLDCDSIEAEELVKEWEDFAREAGLKELGKI